MVSEEKDTETPAGSADGVPIPVAPKVLCLMLGMELLIQTIGVADGGPGF
jgi:hypothetical protein